MRIAGLAESALLLSVAVNKKGAHQWMGAFFISYVSSS
jgi:hypothetical protein